MTKTGNRMLTLLVLLTMGVTTRAQDAQIREMSRSASPAVTISVTQRGVRFAALGSFGKMRLEVFNADSASLYNSDFRAANVRDWALDDKDGQALPDGTYLCVITIREFSGRLSAKQGSVVLKGGQASLQMADGEVASVVEQDKSLAPVPENANTPLTLVGNDGNNGEVVNSQGALTFRFGDFFGGKDKELMRLTEAGNLGIGTPQPEFKLDVAGAVRAREGFIFNDGSTLNVSEKGALTLTSSNGKGILPLTNGGGTVTPDVTGSGSQNKLSKWTDNSGTLGDSVVTELNGNVGIGVTNPTSRFVVGGDGQQTESQGDLLMSRTGAPPYIYTNNPTIDLRLRTGGTGRLMFQPDTATGNVDFFNGKVIVQSSGNVGIGVTSPTSRLVVGGNGQQTELQGDLLMSRTGAPPYIYTNNPTIDFRLRTGGTGRLMFQPDTATGNVDFFNGKVIIQSSGNVGIGTTNPQSALDVSGNFNLTGNATISGNIAAKYQDIAEWTSARTKLASGTVVSLDTLKPNAVIASNRPYDTRVAGVVSAQPGVILGESGPNKVAVATTGRVKVRVNGDRHPIHIGDLLVTSNTPGVAMKSHPFRVHGKIMHRPGTIIGKALESLSTGEGTILVLLTLQ